MSESRIIVYGVDVVTGTLVPIPVTQDIGLMVDIGYIGPPGSAEPTTPWAFGATTNTQRGFALSVNAAPTYRGFNDGNFLSIQRNWIIPRGNAAEIIKTNAAFQTTTLPDIYSETWNHVQVGVTLTSGAGSVIVTISGKMGNQNVAYSTPFTLLTSASLNGTGNTLLTLSTTIPAATNVSAQTVIPPIISISTAVTGTLNGSIVIWGNT